MPALHLLKIICRHCAAFVSISEKKEGLGTYENAPRFFDDKEMKSYPIAERENHFLTVEFNQKPGGGGGEIEMSAKAWHILKRDEHGQITQLPAPVVIQTITLKRGQELPLEYLF